MIPPLQKKNFIINIISITLMTQLTIVNKGFTFNGETWNSTNGANTKKTL